jgi:hypothetical protein
MRVPTLLYNGAQAPSHLLNLSSTTDYCETVEARLAARTPAGKWRFMRRRNVEFSHVDQKRRERNDEERSASEICMHMGAVLHGVRKGNPASGYEGCEEAKDAVEHGVKHARTDTARHPAAQAEANDSESSKATDPKVVGVHPARIGHESTTDGRFVYACDTCALIESRLLVRSTWRSYHSKKQAGKIDDEESRARAEEDDHADEREKTECVNEKDEKENGSHQQHIESNRATVAQEG